MPVVATTSTGVPVGVFAGCLIVGVLGATRYLPALPPGRVAGLCFFVVCGMIGAGLADAGLNIYNAVETGERFLAGVDVSAALAELVWQCALIFGVAAITYLLAARTAGRAEEEGAPREAPPGPRA